MNNEIRDQFGAGKFERTEDGIYFPRSRMLAQGVFSVNKRGEPEEYSENLVVDEGVEYLLKSAMSVGGTSVVPTWYIALFTGAGAPLPGWVAATWATVATEWTAYTAVGGARPAWVKGTYAAGGIDSFGTKAVFTSTDGSTAVIKGAAMLSVSTFGDNPGAKLLAASNFTSDKNLDLGEILDVGYGLLLTPVT